MTQMQPIANNDPRPVGTEFFVFGSYGYTNEEKLHQGSDYAEAKAAYDRAVADPDATAEHQVIELASFAESGEYLTHKTRRQ